MNSGIWLRMVQEEENQWTVEWQLGKMLFSAHHLGRTDAERFAAILQQPRFCMTIDQEFWNRQSKR